MSTVTSPHRTNGPAANAGFSLIELMIGLVIALVTTLVIGQVYSAFEGQKRTTSGGADAQQNGIMALFQIDKDVRAAGFGIRNAAAYGCPAAVPVAVTPHAGGHDPDSLTLRLGNSATQSAPNQFIALSGNSITIENPNAVGFQVGDSLLLYEPSNNNCAVVSITAINRPGAGTPSTLTVNAAPAGTYFAQSTEIYNLGPNYVVRTFAIDPATSRLTQADNGGAPVELADNIVSLKVQYGKDDGSNGGTPDDGVVDTYNALVPVTAVDWGRVISIRLAVIARNPLPERTAVSNQCTNTSGTVNNGPCAWPDSAAVPAPAINLPAGWQNYRYFVYNTVIPIRNSLWKR